jgi:hypothetical protein
MSILLIIGIVIVVLWLLGFLFFRSLFRGLGCLIHSTGHWLNHPHYLAAERCASPILVACGLKMQVLFGNSF